MGPVFELVDARGICNATTRKSLSRHAETLRVQCYWLGIFEIALVLGVLTLGYSTELLPAWLVTLVFIPGSLINHFWLFRLIARRKLELPEG